MYSIYLKSPEGEKVKLMNIGTTEAAEGAKAGITELLKFLVTDMEFEDGYEAEIEKNFQSQPSFWSHHNKSTQ